MLADTTSLQTTEDKRLLVIILASLIGGLICMIAAAIPIVGEESLLAINAIETWQLRHPALFKTVFDALVWQWAAGTAFLVFYYRDWRRARNSRYAVWRTLGVFAIMAISVLSTFIVRQHFLRYSWVNFQPAMVLGEGYATTALYSVVEWLGFKVKNTSGLAASSGFVSLQVMLLLGMWLHAHKRAESSMHAPLWWAANAIALALVIVSRLLLGGHTTADVLLGTAIGVFIYWAVFAILRGAMGQLCYLSRLAIPALSYFLVGLFFCHDPALWLWLGFGGTCCLAILFVWFSIRPPLKRVGLRSQAGGCQ